MKRAFFHGYVFFKRQVSGMGIMNAKHVANGNGVIASSGIVGGSPRGHDSGVFSLGLYAGMRVNK